MNQRILPLLASTIATIIYGVTFTIAKDVMPKYINPYGFILLRVLGATIFFWVIGLFVKSERIAFSDLKKIVLASIFGIAINMLAFFKGLSYTTPISAAVIMVTAPIMVLIFSSFLLKERILPKKIIGIIIGLIGAVVLITYGNSGGTNGKNMVLGNFLVFVNATSYAAYLVIVKELVTKYNPIVFVKWLYLFGLIFVLPFGFSDLFEVDWVGMPTDIYAKAGFVVLFTTCITYLFNLFALSKLKPTTVSVFIYLQPVIASFYALWVGSDDLNIVKIAATGLIFVGVYLVTRR